jgi:ParB family chromosome partitioning protein
MRPKNIAVGELVVSPLNVREDIGDIQSLADSIRDDGLLHPLTVRPYGDQYEIVAGRRRYEACKLIGMKIIPCNVAEDMDDRRAVLTSLKENMRRGDITAAEKKRGIERLLQMNGGDTLANRRKIATSLNMTMAQVKEAIEVGEWAETLEPHNIAVKAPRRGEALGRTIVPTSAAKILMKTLKQTKVRDALGELPKDARKQVEAEVIREAVALKGPKRKEFLKQFEKDPLRPPAEIKREVLAPGSSQPLLMTIPVRIENALYEPLRQFALDNNLGDRVGVAAKNLISEGLTNKGYLQSRPEGTPS